MENLDSNDVMCMCSGTKRGAIIRMFEASMRLKRFHSPQVHCQVAEVVNGMFQSF